MHVHVWVNIWWVFDDVHWWNIQFSDHLSVLIAKKWFVWFEIAMKPKFWLWNVRLLKKIENRWLGRVIRTGISEYFPPGFKIKVFSGVFDDSRFTPVWTSKNDHVSRTYITYCHGLHKNNIKQFGFCWTNSLKKTRFEIKNLLMKKKIHLFRA